MIGLLAALLLVAVCQQRAGIAQAERYAPPSNKGPLGGQVLHVALIGDSYTVQPPVPFPDLIWENLTEEGSQVDPRVSGISGSGYVNGAHQNAVFGNRVAQVVTPDDSLVVFVGSRNDAVEPEMLTKLPCAARAAFAETRNIAKNADLLVIGPIWPEGDAPPNWKRARDIIHTEAVAAGAMWVDPIANGWLVSHPEMLSDEVHPNDVGNHELANLITPIMLRILNGQASIEPKRAPPAVMPVSR